MFLKEKRNGVIKGRGCANGRKQQLWKTKEETSSPTITTKGLFLSCLIDAMEGRCVTTCDIPGAFMQANIDKDVHIKMDGETADLLVRRDPTFKHYKTYEKKSQSYTPSLKKLSTVHCRLQNYFGRTFQSSSLRS